MTVFCFSLSHTSALVMSVACVSSGEGDAVELEADGVEMDDESSDETTDEPTAAIAAALKSQLPRVLDLKVGAVELLQQLLLSLIALQQYVPKSQVCMFQAGTGLCPSKSLFTAGSSVCRSSFVSD
jgi:hypothetical protein